MVRQNSRHSSWRQLGYRQWASKASSHDNPHSPAGEEFNTFPRRASFAFVRIFFYLYEFSLAIIKEKKGGKPACPLIKAPGLLSLAGAAISFPLAEATPDARNRKVRRIETNFFIWFCSPFFF
jgi:hypothetical protein